MCEGVNTRFLFSAAILARSSRVNAGVSNESRFCSLQVKEDPDAALVPLGKTLPR